MSFIIDFTNTSSEEGTVRPDGGFYYTDNLNVINKGQFIFSGSGELKRSLIEVGSQVKVKRNGTLEFHGLVDDIEFYAGGAMSVQASGYEIWLAKENGAFAGSPWTSTASATIFSAIIGESIYFTAGTVEAGTSIDFRANKSSSLWNASNNLRKKTAQDIGIDYPNLEIDILDHKGSSSSVETLNAGIQIGDPRITKGYPIANKVKVYGQSEGQTRIESADAQGQDGTSQSTYGIISYIIEDRTITTVAEANLLANAEVARLKDPRKIYNFDVLNPAKSWVSGDVLTINAPSQGVSEEEVRIVQLKRGVRNKKEFLDVEVTNKEYAELTKSRDEIIAEIDKKQRDEVTYDSYQSEYSNQIDTTTSIGGVIDVYPSFLDLNGYALTNAVSVWGDSSNALSLLSQNGQDINIWPAVGGIINVFRDLDMRSCKITSLANPSANQDAATKCYVDACVAGGGLWGTFSIYICPCNNCPVYSNNYTGNCLQLQTGHVCCFCAQRKLILPVGTNCY